MRLASLCTCGRYKLLTVALGVRLGSPHFTPASHTVHLHGPWAVTAKAEALTTITSVDIARLTVKRAHTPCQWRREESGQLRRSLHGTSHSKRKSDEIVLVERTN
jgi:hypothetical protein